VPERRVVGEPELLVKQERVLRALRVEVEVVMAVSRHRPARGPLEALPLRREALLALEGAVAGMEPDLGSGFAQRLEHRPEPRGRHVVKGVRRPGRVLAQGALPGDEVEGRAGPEPLLHPDPGRELPGRAPARENFQRRFRARPPSPAQDAGRLQPPDRLRVVDVVGEAGGGPLALRPARDAGPEPPLGQGAVEPCCDARGRRLLEEPPLEQRALGLGMAVDVARPLALGLGRRQPEGVEDEVAIPEGPFLPVDLLPQRGLPSGVAPPVAVGPYGDGGRRGLRGTRPQVGDVALRARRDLGPGPADRGQQEPPGPGQLRATRAPDLRVERDPEGSRPVGSAHPEAQTTRARRSLHEPARKLARSPGVPSP